MGGLAVWQQVKLGRVGKEEVLQATLPLSVLTNTRCLQNNNAKVVK